jgi:hypothetical protein
MQLDDIQERNNLPASPYYCGGGIFQGGLPYVCSDLHEYSILSGTEHSLIFTMLGKDGKPAEASYITWGLYWYGNEEVLGPAIKKCAGVLDDGTARIHLDSSTTEQVYGKFIQRITVQGKNGEALSVSEGIFNILRN